MFKPRDYQIAAHEAFWKHVCSTKDDGVIVFPTGAGKTLLLSMVAWTAVRQWGGRVLVLTHRKELLEQQSRTMRKLCPDLDVGINSAGLKRRDTSNAVLLAGVQSVYQRANEIGPRDIVIIDEAHLVSPSDETMYGQLLEDLRQQQPRMRILGLTATPFRLEDGPLCTPDGRFRTVIYRVGVKTLLESNYICPIVNSPETEGRQLDVSKVPKKGGEFVTSALQAALTGQDAVKQAVSHAAEVLKADGRNSTLVFATGVVHGDMVCKEFIDHGFDAHTIFGDTPPDEREQLIKAFKCGDINLMVNCDVLTTGFDAERIDSLVSLRPTCSAGLWMQMVGRGFRLHSSKKNCLVLDYGGNFDRHGPIDSDEYGLTEDQKENGVTEPGEAPMKSCISCMSDLYVQTFVCPYCGVEQPRKEQETTHDTMADFNSAVYEEEAGEWVDIDQVMYFYNEPKKDGNPPTMRVEYYGPEREFPIREWVCVEHSGYALTKAEIWWRCRCEMSMPRDVDSAIYCGEQNMLAEPTALLVGPDPENPRFEKIFRTRLGPIPSEEEWGKKAAETFGQEQFGEDEIPF